MHALFFFMNNYEWINMFCLNLFMCYKYNLTKLLPTFMILKQHQLNKKSACYFIRV